MDKAVCLDTDTSLTGYIVDSNVSTPLILTDRPKPIYTVTGSYGCPGDAFSIGLLYDSYMGPHCCNREEVVKQLMASNDITFETIVKPMVSGINQDTKEFEIGTEVKVSCRFMLRQGQLADEGAGEFLFPDFQLRFVDAVLDEREFATPTVIDPEVLKAYDF